MALFGKKTEEKKETREAVASAPVSRITERDLARVLKNPRITEKATAHQEAGIYTFDVVEGTTKREVAEAVSSLYKVMPRKVRVVTVPAKRKRNVRTGAAGVARGGKKAYVYLKKGDSITIT